MTKKIYYGSFAVMAFKCGAYLVASWAAFVMVFFANFRYWWGPAPWYIEPLTAVLIYPPLVPPVILLILGLVCGRKWVTGWRWWNAIGMLAVGAAAFCVPFALWKGYFVLASLLGI